MKKYLLIIFLFIGCSDNVPDNLISKEKMEIASTICKVDLMSDLVGEFPELQGIMGGYFAEAQGFEKDVSIAIAEHYLPIGMESVLPKKPYSIALSLSDKIDSLVGFFGINLKPSSSKDPYALRRMTISLVRLIIENNQKGVLSKKYVPGPLSEMEKGLEKFKSWYLKHLEISIS